MDKSEIAATWVGLVVEPLAAELVEWQGEAALIRAASIVAAAYLPEGSPQADVERAVALWRSRYGELQKEITPTRATTLLNSLLESGTEVGPAVQALRDLQNAP